MNSYLLKNEIEKEEQDNYINEEIENTIEMQMKSSRSIDDIKACVKIRRGLEQINNATLLFNQIKERNALAQLFYHIRCENLVNSKLESNNTLRFMAWFFKVMKNINKEFTKLYEIQDILLKEVGILVIEYSEFDREYVDEQLMKLKELVETLEEENCKFKTSLDNEIFNKITDEESGSQILYNIYNRIVEIIPEIKKITQEDIDEYMEEEKKIYNQFFVL